MRKDLETQEQTNASVSKNTFNLLIVAVVFFVVGLGLGYFLFNQPAAPAIDTAELDNIVRNAVDEALVDFELSMSANVNVPEGGAALTRADIEGIVRDMDEQNAANELAALADNDPFLGAEDAVVTIVEFSDFNCSFCGRFAQQTLPRIIETYGDQVKFVYRDMPILAASSAPAAEASHCADEQGAFWAFHDYMFDNTQARDRDAYIAFAEDNNLDVQAFTDCIDEGRYSGEVTLDLFDGQELGVNGTPAFYINGRFVSGAQPFDVFAAIIDMELEAAASEG